MEVVAGLALVNKKVRRSLSEAPFDLTRSWLNHAQSGAAAFRRRLLQRQSHGELFPLPRLGTQLPGEAAQIKMNGVAPLRASKAQAENAEARAGESCG